jgi:predicted nucleic acid-binding protein
VKYLVDTELPLNRSIMRRFARIKGELRRAGQIIGDPDKLIAATARHHGLILITRNRRHFSLIEGLALYEAS